MVLILLVAGALRIIHLSAAPPGMTHDEADHGITAWSIVNGARDIYFTIGYGREPLYDYATALLMAGTGPTILAARMTSVYFSLLLVAGMFAWTRRAFGHSTALLTAAGLAVSFWPVMAGRQALRSIALPALFVLAILFFWQALYTISKKEKHATDPLLSFARRSSVRYLVMAGILLGLSIYTYIPARVLWLCFPALVGYHWLAARSSGDPTTVLNKTLLIVLVIPLIVAAALALPLFLYLSANPGLEVRVNELSAPLQAAVRGDFAPLWTNFIGSLRLVMFEGDQTWRYNIPGKPFLGPLMGLLFYGGVVLGLWLAMFGLKRGARQGRLGFNSTGSPGSFLALVWLLLGIAPVLVTGPGLSMTQAIGAMPVIYLFPALAMVAIYRGSTTLLASKHPNRQSQFGTLAAILLYAAIGLLTIRDYFGLWTNHPEVRVQYETTMMTAMDLLNRKGAGAAAVSTITPGQYHTPAVAQLAVNDKDVVTRWFDGRQSLLIPGEPRSLVIIPGFTPLPPALASVVGSMDLVEEIPMRPDDLDRPIQVYSVNGPAVEKAILETLTTEVDGSRTLPARFGEHIDLLGYDLSTTSAHPGDVVTLVTVWRLKQKLPGVTLFTHIVGDEQPLVQADSLGAPGESWIAGDMLLQLHEISLPDDSPAGEYPVAVGAYLHPTGQRLLVANDQDILPLSKLIITHE
jgi:4-amino-4-deoxy-L-arabinose transferase-like glycosyltransferase